MSCIERHLMIFLAPFCFFPLQPRCSLCVPMFRHIAHYSAESRERMGICMYGSSQTGFYAVNMVSNADYIDGTA